MARVQAPAAGFEGTVAGVTFEDGTGETTDPVALAYFRRHGYTVGGRSRVATPPEPADPRAVGTKGDGVEPVGTRLRDAAVDPKPDDFLPPTNAGRANPHGPEVVSPGLHGVEGVRPVLPGPVAPAGPQGAVETADTAAHTDAVLSAPARNASKADWTAYALAQGGDPDDVAVLTRDALIEKYGTTKEATVTNPEPYDDQDDTPLVPETEVEPADAIPDEDEDEAS